MEVCGKKLIYYKLLVTKGSEEKTLFLTKHPHVQLKQNYLTIINVTYSQGVALAREKLAGSIDGVGQF